MCKYCDNLDVTGRGQNIAIRKDDLYRDFMQLICFPKTEMNHCRVIRWCENPTPP